MEKDIILKAENVSKQYRLGQVGTGTLSHDLNRWWHEIRGKENPYLKIGDSNDRSTKGNSDYVWALQDINFEVERGDVLGIIGKNGAGKSTLLKILSKVTAPTIGSIKSRGRIASLLEVGTGFNSEMTGRENIFLNGAILGMTKKEIKLKINDIIEFSGCERYIDTPVKRYSSGMTVRLAFAVAAFLEPEILVVDEVLAVGDAEFQKKAIGKMQDISKGEGRTVLFVSHNMAAVKSLCTRGIVLEHGKVVFEGDQNESVDFYLKRAESRSEINLIDRNDRLGSGKLKVKSVQLLNKNFQELNEVISGEMLIIKVTFVKYIEIDYKKMKVAINFQDENESFILSFINDEMNHSFHNLENQDYFYLQIPNLYLRAASYSLRIMLSETDTHSNNFIDVIEKVIDVDVLPGDIWKTGITNRKGHAAIIPGEFI
ncbi:lipopolysaccharide transport system ATP-binding protein [Flavobacterium chryseum]|uniref:ABC transporter ATP-binding protein n=1 Tax=Flavobacterium sp. P3160 TaxID=2512113 RepID=UPI001061D162|nr:ABC transporter ATP-binding protein [Flavobacterium sp. P3160]TDO77461.1 lipopolysaccharide transport system ATP-binding protein [Flavobacterium sp. P3160]